ncbi:MAG: L-threonylcarbamoyladenylate synthase [Patescibacteria group bacterium]|nr:L-threonylcarbamoyladenylate synthase [Patescibacteria group bacterium]
MKEHLVVHENDLLMLAKKVLAYLGSYTHTKASVILLEGDLGTGKTTFTQVIAKELGVEDDVHSPTFILKKEYVSSHASYRNVVHIDAYRFNDPNEAKVLRLEDDIEDPHTIIFIEWPSKMAHVPHDVLMMLDVLDDDTRDVTIHYEKNR